MFKNNCTYPCWIDVLECILCGANAPVCANIVNASQNELRLVRETLVLSLFSCEWNSIYSSVADNFLISITTVILSSARSLLRPCPLNAAQWRKCLTCFQIKATKMRADCLCTLPDQVYCLKQTFIRFLWIIIFFFLSFLYPR